jgi:dimethylamine/trimethylamine dehydrogenase
MPNVELYPGSLMSAEDVLESGLANIILATGASWRRDGLGRTLHYPIPGHQLEQVFNPDDLMEGRFPTGRVLVYDDDHYYMGSVLAELLVQQGCLVTFVTPAPSIAEWSKNTLEQPHILRKLLALGVELRTHTYVEMIEADRVLLSSELKREPEWVKAEGIVLVTNRISNDGLYYQLQANLTDGRLKSLGLIGDAEAPNLIVQAVFAGHKAAQEFEGTDDGSVPFRREHLRL